MNKTHSTSISLHSFRNQEWQHIIDYIPTNEMAVDGLTKGLTGEKHSHLIQLLQMESCPSGSDRNRYS